MYVQRAEITVAGGRFANIQPWIDRRVEHLRGQKGFRGYLVLKSLGVPAKGVALIQWEERESYIAWVEGTESAAFTKANPTAGLFTLNRPQEAYEDVCDIGRAGTAGFASLVDWQIKPGAANLEAFETSRKGAFELRREYEKGYMGGRLLRFLGVSNRYLVVNLFATRDDQRSLVANPKVQEFVRAHPEENLVAAPFIYELFEVVLRV